MGKFMKRGLAMIVIIITIILIILMGITIGGRTRISTPENIIGKVITPIQRFFFKGGQMVEGSFRSIFAFRSISEENEQLKKELEELNKEVISLQLQNNDLEELRDLREALRYIEENRIDNYLTASVTGKDMGNWFNMFIINAGENHGVVKDSTVMNGDGLVGKVYETAGNWSKVLSIIDNKSSVSFEILRNDQYVGVVKGSVNSNLTGYLIDPEAEVLIGDKLITSGLSVYPKGILVGSVKEVTKKEDELLKTIIVEPSVNFRRLNKVFVIIPDKID